MYAPLILEKLSSLPFLGQYTGHHQQQQQNGQHAHQNGYPYSSPASQSGSAARGARPSRLATVYPIPQGNGQHSPHNANQLAQQQHQHLQQAQQIQLQQQQQQQMLRQQQQQLLQQQQQQQHSHHQAHSNGTKQRRRNTEGEAEEEADEGEADGEDQTPYCFCQRPSFGEVRSFVFLGSAYDWLIFGQTDDRMRCPRLRYRVVPSFLCRIEEYAGGILVLYIL